MANKVFLSQRTARHVVKRIDSTTKLYETHFGIYGTVKTDNTGLNYPFNMAADVAGNVYVCDGKNQRIMKLDKNLVYQSNVDVSAEIGIPYTIYFDPISGDLYIAGIKDYLTISIARMDTALSVSKYNSNISVVGTNEWPMGVSSDFTAGYFLISGLADLLKVQETGGGFNTAVTQAIGGEPKVGTDYINTGSKFFGHIRHSNGDLYFSTKRVDGSRISRVNSSYDNVGDSNKYSKLGYYISEGAAGDLLVYDNQRNAVQRYGSDLNFKEQVYSDGTPVVATDGKEIYGMLEFSV